MYLVGVQHPNKIAARRALELCINQGERLVTSAGVLREILHRYAAIGRLDAIQPAFNALTDVVDEIFPIELADVKGVKDVVLGGAKLSARDALHVAVMKRRSIVRIMSFDSGFDGVQWVERVR